MENSAFSLKGFDRTNAKPIFHTLFDLNAFRITLLDLFGAGLFSHFKLCIIQEVFGNKESFRRVENCNKWDAFNQHPRRAIFRLAVFHFPISPYGFCAIFPVNKFFKRLPSLRPVWRFSKLFLFGN